VSLRGPNRYVEPLAWLREGPELQHAVFRHWCAAIEVVVAVKAAAWESTALEVVGFYAHTGVINANAADRRVFYAKDDARLVRVGEATLKREGEHAYLFAFSGAGPCEPHRTGRSPRGVAELKPYLRFAGERLRRR
jgi:hypothetical protein